MASTKRLQLMHPAEAAFLSTANVQLEYLIILAALSCLHNQQRELLGLFRKVMTLISQLHHKFPSKLLGFETEKVHSRKLFQAPFLAHDRVCSSS